MGLAAAAAKLNDGAAGEAELDADTAGLLNENGTDEVAGLKGNRIHKHNIKKTN